MKTNIGKILAVLLIIAIPLSVVIYFYRSRPVNYTLVLTYENTLIGGTWEIVRDHGFYSRETFINNYEKQTGDVIPNVFEENGCTIVLCYGYTLEKLFYREANMSGRFTGVYPFYYANAYLKPADPNLIYVYIVEDNIRIDRDIHTNNGRDTKILK